MSKQKSHVWNIEALKEYFDALLVETDRRYVERFNSHEKAVDAALNAHQQAVEKAEEATEKRFDAINEFRQALSDAYGAMMPRPEFAQAFGGLNEKLEILAGRVSQNMARSEVEARVNTLDQKVDARGAGFDQKIDELQKRMERSEGRAQGLNRGWALLIGVIGLVATATSIYAALSGHIH
jgi:DNA repair exonuclease SbcCD ATPase subunit